MIAPRHLCVMLISRRPGENRCFTNPDPTTTSICRSAACGLRRLARSPGLSSPVRGSAYSKRPQQQRRERLSGGFEAHVHAQRSQVDHVQPGVAARVDAAKRLQIHGDVERHAMVAAAAANSKANARELAT